MKQIFVLPILVIILSLAWQTIAQAQQTNTSKVGSPMGKELEQLRTMAEKDDPDAQYRLAIPSDPDETSDRRNVINKRSRSGDRDRGGAGVSNSDGGRSDGASGGGVSSSDSGRSSARGWNSGGRNTGDRNSGRNTGDRNGGRNTGDRNGGRNTGDRNGGRNTGDRNGGSNTGDRGQGERQ